MSNSIGNASLLLSANGAKLQSDLASAEGKIRGWAGRVTGRISTTISGIMSKMTAVVNGQGLAGLGISGPIGVGIGAITGLIGGAISRLNDFGRIAKEATTLSIDISQYAGLQQVLERGGLAAENTMGFFANLGRQVSDTAAGIGRAGVVFQMLGLDAQALANVPIDEQFLQIAEAISKLPSAAQQAQAALRLGIDAHLLPTLQRGRAGIMALIDTLKASGAVLSSAEMAQAQEATRAWKLAANSLAATWTGVVNRLTILFAPVLSAVAEVTSEVFQLLSQIIKDATDGIKTWASGLAQAGIAVPTMRDIVIGAFRAIGVVGAYVFDSIKIGIAACVLGFGKLVNFAKQLPDTVRPAWVNEFQGVSDWADSAVSSFGQSASAVNSFFDTLQRRQRTAAATQQNLTGAIGAGAIGRQLPSAAPFTMIKAITAGSEEALKLTYQREWQARNPGAAQPARIEAQQLAELRGIRQDIQAGNNRESMELELV